VAQFGFKIIQHGFLTLIIHKKRRCFFTSAMSAIYPDIAANNNKTFSRLPFFRVYINLNVRIGWIGTDVFYPSGEPILQHLLRYDPFAVDNHSCMGHASHPLMPGRGGGSRLVNNQGSLYF
jgi:hypothetical protein